MSLNKISTNYMNLLLINDKIPDIDFIKTNLLENTTYVIFNQSSDTYQSLLDKIPLNDYINVGILQDNPFNPTYTFLDSFGASTLKNVKTLDPELSTWTNLIELINYFKTLGITQVHFMECNEISDDWKYIKSKLLETLQVVISVSLNKTGLGGDWILESDNVNLVGLYFTQGIKEYPYTLGVSSTFGSTNGIFFPNFHEDDTTGGIIYNSKVINKNKQLVFWGGNGFGEFGTFNRFIEEQPFGPPPISYYYKFGGTRYFTPTLSNVINVASGYHSTLAVLDETENNVYTAGLELWNNVTTGGDYEGFRQIENSNTVDIKIVKIVANLAAFIYLGSNGYVYSSGLNPGVSGQTLELLGLGLGLSGSSGQTITKIDTLSNIKDINISLLRSYFINDNNILYICGTETSYIPTAPNINNNHSLGILNVTSVSVPRKLTYANGSDFNVSIKSVSPGYLHTFALDVNGNIWAWGTVLNNATTLSIGFTPTRINPDDVLFKEVSTGYNHVVAIDISGNLWVAGNNSSGQLGTGNKTSTPINVLTKINYPKLFDLEYNVIGDLIPYTIISTGLTWTIIGYLDSNGDILMATCGKNGFFRVRDPYDPIDIRTNFTKSIDSTAPILYNPFPYISSISKTKGVYQDSITLIGKKFLGSTVTFDSTPCIFYIDSDTEIRVTVPNVTGQKNIIVRNIHGPSNDITFTTISPPTIINLSSPTVSQGSLLIIEGTDFVEVSTVFLGSIPYNFVVDSPSQITATVPTNLNIMEPISVGITVINIAGASNDRNVVITPNSVIPRQIMLSPIIGLQGSIVTITGYFPDDTIVIFGSTTATIQFKDVTQITAIVPDVTGINNVRINSSEGVSYSIPFTVLIPPTIENFTPITGVKNNLVIIDGTNFTPDSTVTFGTTSALVEFISDTQLKAIVPDVIGTNIVTITTNGGNANSSFDILIPPTIDALSYVDVTNFNNRVFIDGSNFTPDSIVIFDDEPAEILSNSETGILVKVPQVSGLNNVRVVNINARVFSDIKPFEVISLPTITQYPMTGNRGSTITIIGTSFNGSTVTLGGVTVIPDSISNTQITLTVPLNATIGVTTINIANFVGNFNRIFTVTTSPEITTYTTSGTPGSIITIIGSYFTDSTVLFNGELVTPNSISDTEITLTIPINATKGEKYISITNADGGIVRTFTVVFPPTISEITPKGIRGSQVSITGSNFLGSTVIFAGVTVTPDPIISDTEITLTVPLDATRGDNTISVSNVAGDDNFIFRVFLAPTLSINPSSGLRGSTVTLTGTDFTDSTVTFGGVTVTSGSISDTQITLTVPSNATRGIKSIIVTNDDGPSTSQSFTVLIPPTIATLSSSSGLRGSAVTLTGTNLLGSTVTFGGVTVTPDSISDTQITLTVPSNATRGLKIIRVSTSDGNVERIFTVLTPPTIATSSHVRGAQGRLITLTGSNFLLDSVVTFGTEVAEFEFISNTEIRVTVPNITGMNDISVTHSDGSSNIFEFTITSPPIVDSISANTGSQGMQLTIRGSNFLESTVLFGSIPAEIEIVSDEEIRAYVPAGTGTVVITINNDESSNGVAFTYMNDSINICFIAGTLIQTDQGTVEIEKINVKHTIYNKKIIAITKTKSKVGDTLILFEKDSIAPNYPIKDTIISRRHKIFYNGVFKQAYTYVNQITIRIIPYNNQLLYNVLLKTHSFMRANGLVCETLNPQNKVALLYIKKIREGMKQDKIFVELKESKESKSFKSLIYQNNKKK